MLTIYKNLRNNHFRPGKMAENINQAQKMLREEKLY